ncbi:hypothetical protein HPB47_002874 [Ixodes persulcatus]|uniref:Uncharacterized protein n=1 Tax=Ixodes persulcatus TaxID=34615 RepID=A0AC60PK92_IXOPE|nr:hypothetical protein HPB47_002874 [Ixodes persulcatus]
MADRWLHSLAAAAATKLGCAIQPFPQAVAERSAPAVVERSASVDEASCGRVYFITWTKNVSEDWQRVYLFSETVNRVMGPLSEPHRATFHPGNASAHLRIQPLTVEDEGTYKCDVTYVQGKCPSLSFTRLQTLEFIMAL